MNEPKGDARWMICTTRWRQETVALDNVERQKDRDGRPLFEAYLPMHHQLVRPKGQPERVQPLPFFPRYMFVKVDMTQEGWTKLYSTRGLCGVLPSGRWASDVLGRMVADMRQREVKGFLQLMPGELPCRWAKGERVTYGGYLDAIFQERVDERRCRILVSLLGADSLQTVDLAELQ